MPTGVILGRPHLLERVDALVIGVLEAVGAIGQLLDVRVGRLDEGKAEALIDLMGGKGAVGGGALHWLLSAKITPMSPCHMRIAALRGHRLGGAPPR